jgi:hypothetical protein
MISEPQRRGVTRWRVQASCTVEKFAHDCDRRLVEHIKTRKNFIGLILR